MEPTVYIGIAGLALAVPSSAMALSDLHTRRTGRETRIFNSPRNDLATSFAPLSIPRRILSMIIDTYVVAIAAGGLGYAVIPDPTAPSEDLDAAIGLAFIALVIALAAWNAVSGRSPGKLLVGGRVVRYSDPQVSLSFVRSVVRVVCHAIPFGFWLVLGPARRTAADRITDSCVIHTR